MIFNYNSSIIYCFHTFSVLLLISLCLREKIHYLQYKPNQIKVCYFYNFFFIIALLLIFVIIGKMNDSFGEVLLEELKATRPKTSPLPPATLVDSFTSYLAHLMAGLPSNVTKELQEDILALVFAAKKKTNNIQI